MKIKTFFRYLSYLILFVTAIYGLTDGHINLNPIDLWHKANAFVERNMDYGGIHRIAIVYAVLSPFIIFTLIKIIQEKKHNEDK